MKTVKIIIWSVGILIAGYFILAMVTTPSPVVGDYFNRKEFNSERWKSWEESEAEPSLRWKMVHDLRNKHEIIGKTRLEIKELLGEPERETENKIRYYLGMSGHGVDTGSLILKMKEDRVVDIHVWHG